MECGYDEVCGKYCGLCWGSSACCDGVCVPVDCPKEGVCENWINYVVCGNPAICDFSSLGTYCAHDVCDGKDNDCNGVTDDWFCCGCKEDGPGRWDWGKYCHDGKDCDLDNVLDENDNCPCAYNPKQEDLDNDGLGDECDLDNDGDGIPDDEDCAPLTGWAPNCDARECGDDGCGGSCGICPEGLQCDGSTCQETLCGSEKECGGNGWGGCCEPCPVGEVCVAGFCMSPACVIHVDAANIQDAFADGSTAHPFEAIQDALEATPVGQDCVIKVAAGDYDGDFVVETPGVRLCGSCGDEATLVSLDQGVVIAADDVTLSGLDIIGGTTVLRVGADDAVFSSIQLVDLDVGGADRNGIQVTGVVGLEAHDLSVQGIGSWAESSSAIPSVGVAVFEAEGVVVRRVRIKSIIGHHGVHGEAECIEGEGCFDGCCWETSSGTDGATAIGMDVAECSNCLLEEISLRSINGGSGGMGDHFFPGYPGYDCGSGGSAIGFRLVDVDATVASNILVDDLRAGNEGESWCSPGVGCGILIEAGSDSTLSGFTLHALEGNSYGTSEPKGICISGEGFSVHGGVFAHEGACVMTYGTSPDSTVSHSLYSGCEPVPGVSIGPGVIEEPAKFLDAYLHLAPDSPGIDAGDPCLPCIEEPEPNGCRIDMGAYAGTPQATPVPGAEHCAVCPLPDPACP